MHKPFRLPFLLTVVGAMALSTAAHAQTWPAKPVRVIASFAAGSAPDIICRLVMDRVTRSLGQQMIVENRPGASNVIGAQAVASATPDGYTMLVGATGPTVVNSILVKHQAFDPQRAFAPITLTATNNLLMTVPNSLPAKTVREFIELARAKPGQLRFGSPGIGSSPHLTGELLKSLAGIDMVHVPYKGSPQYTIDLLAGRIDVVIASAGALLPHIRSGRLRLIAVSTAQRDPAYPDVPAINETVPGFDVFGWFGLLTTAGTPASVMKKLHAELARILAEPEVKSVYNNAGLDVAISQSPAEFAALIAREREKWARVIRTANIRIEE